MYSQPDSNSNVRKCTKGYKIYLQTYSKVKQCHHFILFFFSYATKKKMNLTDKMLIIIVFFFSKTALYLNYDLETRKQM